MRKLITVAAALAATAAVTLTTPALAGPKEEQAVRDRDAYWNTLFVAKDLDGVAGMYAPDATFMPPGSPPVQGAAAIRASWAPFIHAPGFRLVLTPDQVTSSASGDLVIDRGHYVSAVAGAPEDHGKYVVVWKKVGGVWKPFHDIFNSDLPAAPPAK